MQFDNNSESLSFSPVKFGIEMCMTYFDGNLPPVVIKHFPGSSFP